MPRWRFPLSPFGSLVKSGQTKRVLVCSIRFSSSRRRNQFQLDALPFTVSPDEAYKKFESWAVNEQGLGPLISVGGPIGSANVLPMYAPFWYFKLNVRFGGGTLIPEPFKAAFVNSPNGIVHIPGLAAYSGFSYRRSLIDPIHNTTLVFKSESIVPFGSWMLNPVKFRATTLDVFPDPWNATRERAFSVVYDELNDIANPYLNDQSDPKVQVEVERLSSKRIYMPTYVIEYTILGVTYQAFVSGCDASVEVSGISHNTMFEGSDEMVKGAASFLSRRAAPIAASALQFFGLRPFVALGQVMWGFVSRIAMKVHIFGFLAGGAVMAWRKLFRPYIDDRAASEEWKQERDHDARMDSFKYREFRDATGASQAYFARNRERILRHLRGKEGRQQQSDGQEWYSQWEEWAKQQWENAQREAYQQQSDWQRKQYGYQQQRQQQGQQSHQQKSRPRDEIKWDFDTSDPYSVLGIQQGATKDQVSKAFRRNMLKYHPDTMTGASEKEKRIATERSKLITDAYRKIKASLKR